MATKKSLSTIVMLGDVMLGRIVDEALTVMPNHAAIWGDTLPLLSGDAAPDGDPERVLVSGNLECAITAHQKPAPKTFNFKLSPHNIAALAPFKFVSLANNHILDYFAEGLVETTTVLDSHGIAYTGAGTAEQAAKPAIVEKLGTKIAFLSYSDHYKEWAAPQNDSHVVGINFIDPDNYDKTLLQKQLQDASTHADLVIVFIHWGPNWAWHPNKSIQQLAHDIIDFGGEKVAAVFGHSAHHIQGIEVRAGKPIIYGAGGYIDDYALDKVYRNDLGFMYCLHVDVEDSSSSGDLPPPRLRELELIPTKITHEWRQPVGSAKTPYFSYVNRAKAEDKAWLWKKVKTLSAEFGTKIVEGPRGFRIPF
jgi:poly-gamma-glutamate capsule biosynthesis protein CapA/YwtB (metallophosphatase superfamily)